MFHLIHLSVVAEYMELMHVISSVYYVTMSGCIGQNMEKILIKLCYAVK